MSSSALYRLSGLALIIGGVASAILNIVNNYAFPSNNNGFDPKVVTATPWLIVQLLLLIAGTVLLLGLPGIYLRQAKQTGTVALIGFVLLFITMFMISIGVNIVDVLVLPFLAIAAPKLVAGNGPASLNIYFIVAMILLTVGTILFSIATLRAAILPRPATGVLLAALVLTLATLAPLPSLLNGIISTVSFVLLYLALAWYGYALLSVREEPAIESQTLATDMSVPA